MTTCLVLTVSLAFVTKKFNFKNHTACTTQSSGGFFFFGVPNVPFVNCPKELKLQGAPFRIQYNSVWKTFFFSVSLYIDVYVYLFNCLCIAHAVIFSRLYGLLWISVHFAAGVGLFTEHDSLRIGLFMNKGDNSHFNNIIFLRIRCWLYFVDFCFTGIVRNVN